MSINARNVKLLLKNIDPWMTEIKKANVQNVRAPLNV